MQCNNASQIGMPLALSPSASPVLIASKCSLIPVSLVSRSFTAISLSLSLSHVESAFSPLNQIALPLFMLVAARLFDCPFQLPPPLLCVRGYPDGSSGRPFLLPPSMHPTGQLLNVGQGPTATRWLPVTCERASACLPSLPSPRITSQREKNPALFVSD